MSQAWLLDLGAGCSAAVGIGELVHLLYSPPMVSVPHTPAHAQHVVEWNGQLLPLIDLNHWLRGAPGQQNLFVVGVIASQGSLGSDVQYAGLRLAAPPARVNVEDGQSCPLPAPAELWEMVAISCFEHNGTATPILDTARLTTMVLPQHPA